MPGKASDLIRPIDELKPGTKVILFARESAEKNRPHLNLVLKGLRKIAKQRGLIVVAEYAFVGLGYDHEFENNSNLWSSHIVNAARIARVKGAVILTESTDRFCRRKGFHPSRFRVPPRQIELDNLRDHAAGIQLFTVLHPDAPLSESTSFQTKRGQSKSQKCRGGRPPKKVPGEKKEAKAKLFKATIKLHQIGWSVREIADFFEGPKKSTIYDWIAEHAKVSGFSHNKPHPEQLSLKNKGFSGN